MELSTIRHSAAHIMAQAVQRLYKNVTQGIGPAIENGFYQDFQLSKIITKEDFPKIEKEMKKIIKENLEFKEKEISKKEAKEIFKKHPYKLEMIKELPGKTVTIYTCGESIDLCKGPHLKSTGELRAYKLQNITMAYWKGDSKNKQLQRIYGTAFKDKKELRKHLFQLEEAKKRDHNKLGKELGLFVHSEVVGKGLPLLTPKGATIKRILRRFIEDEEIKRGYEYTDTPVLTRSELYKISGHLDHFKKDMFVFKIGKEEMALRPMTCPHQFMIYKSRKWSYKELPVRYAEVAKLFRNEQSGELHGLIRIRQFTLADAHIMCTPNQLKKEFKDVVELIQYLMKTLGFTDFWYRFSKWDPKNKKKYIDNPKGWERTQKEMKKILDLLKIEYVEAEDEAAFYGPKLDIQMKNVFGKEDTLFTVQIDMALAERFDMTYIGEDNKEHRPMIIHRASIGCLERTMAMLIEHYAGKFPVWLSPEQVALITVSDKHKKYTNKLAKEMRNKGIRVKVDDRVESIPKKVRDNMKSKVPYVVTIGDKELETNNLAIRTRDNKVTTKDKKEFIKQILKEIKDRC